MTSKPLPTSVDASQDGLPATMDTEPEGPQVETGFILRVKPDRRRVQLFVPPQLDRRRKQ